MKHISFDGRHAIPFPLLTDDEKRRLLRTVRDLEALQNGWFIAQFSGRLIRLTAAEVLQLRAVQVQDLILPGDQAQAVYYKAIAETKRTRLSRNAPGGIALKLVDFLCNAKTVEKTFKPLVADWRSEYFEALTANRRIKARWISVRYMWYFVLALGITRVLSLVRPVLPGIVRSRHATPEQDRDNHVRDNH